MPIETPAGTLTVENAILEASSFKATTAVGIGTDNNDAYPLQIFKETGPDIRIQEGTTQSSAARLYSNNSNLYIQTGTNFSSGSSGDIAFQNMQGQSTHMVIKSDGKVGVGTTDPHQRIDLGDAGGSIRLGRDNDSTTVTNRIGRTDLAGTNWVASVDFIDDGDSDDAIAFRTHQAGVFSGERMRIGGNGNVGIGTANPLYPFHIHTDTKPQLFIEGNDNSNATLRSGSGPNYRNTYQEIDFGHYAIVNRGADNYIDFKVTSGEVAPTTRMRINGNGNVGIGTSPEYKLHIYSGNDSISWYGPNTSWGGILAVGASPDRTVTNNSEISQVIVTNGNLHLDAAHNREVFINHYSGTNVKFGSAGTVIHSSDDRLKTQEELIENATDTIMKLRPQKYLKSFRLPEDGDTREPVLESGLIVQDLWYDAPELRHLVKLADDANPSEEKPPEPVPGDIQQDPDYSDWGTMPAGMSYIGLIPYLIKSNQELHTELQDTKSQLTSVLARLDALENAP